MTPSFRIIPTRLRKNIFLAALAVLLLSAFPACSFQKSVVCSDFSDGKMSGPSAGFLNDTETASAIVQIALITPHGRYPAKAALIIKKPSYLRLEILPVIGAPEFVLAASPEKLNIFIPAKDQFYTGKPTGANLQKFLPWPIEIAELVKILTGAYPSFDEKNSPYPMQKENNRLRFDMESPSRCSQTVWLGDDKKILERVLRDETGNLLYRAKYIYNGNAAGFPEKIIIIMTDGATSLTVTYADVKIEEASDLSVFNLKSPVGAKVIELE